MNNDLQLHSIVENRISGLFSGAEDDPPLILDWNIQNLESFVMKINNYQGNVGSAKTFLKRFSQLLMRAQFSLRKIYKEEPQG
jgi:hypothetical protein